MISSLNISNYALIKKLEINPVNGLNIITGETGAGKSIMLGAVGLLLGKRADTKALLNKEVKCVVEAVFDISDYNLEDFFDALDLDYEQNTIIRREISPKGKSRAFVNDLPVTLDILKNLGLKLIDIHSQNESIHLGDKSVKLSVIDNFAGCGGELKDYQQKFNDYKRIEKQLDDLIQTAQRAQKDADYRNFLLVELINAELDRDEQQKLEAELKVLENAEEIKLNIGGIVAEFSTSDISINDQLKDTANVLKSTAQFSDSLEQLHARFQSATEEIKDIIGDLESVNEHIEHDPERISFVNQRLDLLYQLQQKHQVQDVKGLIEIREKLDNESLASEDIKKKSEALKVKKDAEEKQVILAAEHLSEKRRVHLDPFSDAMNELLEDVGMPDGHLEVVYKRVNPWPMGIDEMEFLFSANKGIKPEPVGNIASGGEFSRLMFCIKYLLADKTAMPTVIFDEIDTGVSGEIAMKLATMMKKMGENHQVIAISHLPQIAAKGESHYFVYKNNEADKAESQIKKLDATARIEEIAKMIGGENPSQTAINSAKELIEMN